ncbi:sulfate adenylyltransferase [Alicyclobacillus mengziensis]|uniref:Sulfate adenylyltransferase n=1 Tax=Alicyclobacillus mengziensis TaxID=2931921 RepID=A0A9X7Z749_9BACL|nr:sulfate adenylyltransferase [Alicyclobacillus mengziensis]QSO46863.1 sulfate adenylyltransferase [Alicyclobacillus mengziensis]
MNTPMNVETQRPEDIYANCREIVLDDVAASDVLQIGIGAFAPLKGFLGEADYLSVCASMRLSNGELWPIPVTLPVSEKIAVGLTIGERIRLVLDDGLFVAGMVVTDVYRPDLEMEADSVYGTTDTSHPGVKRLFERGSVYLGGPVEVYQTIVDPEFEAYFRTPRECRVEFQKRGWKTIVGFQTRNPIHRAHEYIQKCALETVDALFIHPLVGPTKADDVPAPVRMRAYRAILENYYPRERTYFSVLMSAMRYAGPKEAVLHALVRKNYGCTHFIVGRDHAGVGNFYGTYDAQKLLLNIPAEDLGIIPMCFDHAFYCRSCGGMATTKTCPHPDEDHTVLSGTKVRKMLAEGIAPPPEFSRPEVVRVLMEYYQNENQ